MSKSLQVERADVLSISLLVAGLALVTVAILAMYGVFFAMIGDWDWWVLIIGVIVILVGGIWSYTYTMNVRKFRNLMNERSKAAFIKRLEDLEYLAWQLPTRFEEELRDKKKRLGLK